MATFHSHRRRKAASITSGAGQKDIYEPIWFAYKKMEEFLGPVYHCGRTTSTMDDDDDASPVQPEEQRQHETEEAGASDNERQQKSRQADDGTQLNTSAMSRDFAVPTTHREKRHRLATEIDGARDQTQQTFATLNNVLNNKTINEVDDCELYGQLLAKKLRNYSIHERHLLMHEIDGLLLQKPPRSTMLCQFSSYSSSSAPSPVNRCAPVSINTLNEPSSTTSYTLLSSQSPPQVNISSRPSSSKQLQPQLQQSPSLIDISTQEATGNVNM